MDEVVRVTTVEQLDGTKLAAFGVHGEWVAIAVVDGSYYAFEDICPHLQCSLAGGNLQGTSVICPCHGSEFDVTSGKRLAGPARRDIRTYPVHLEDGVLTIER
jgi:nitrite reductase/ring-hydroxylating ferredoxin subunit